MARRARTRRAETALPPARLSWRARLAVAILAAAALLPPASVAVQLLAVGLPAGPRADPISAFEQRLAPVRAALAGTVRVGYLAPPGQPAERAAARLYLTRYALAPVLVLDELTAVLLADGVRDRAALPAGYRVERDFGDGLLLLRAVAPAAAERAP